MTGFTPAVLPPQDGVGEAYWFVFRGGDILVRRAGGRIEVPRDAQGLTAGTGAGQGIYLGTLGEHHCYACEADPQAPLPDGMEYLPLRTLVLHGDEVLTDVAGRAMQIKEWDRTRS